MSNITVSQLSKVIGVETNTLLEKLNLAGVEKSAATDEVTDEEKGKLLNFIQGSQTAPKTITLKRKSTQQLKVGGSRKVNIEVRKKRTIAQPADDNSIEEAKALEQAKAAEAEAQQKALEAEKAAEMQKLVEEAKQKALEAEEAAAKEQAAKPAEEVVESEEKPAPKPTFRGNISQAALLEEKRVAERAAKKAAEALKEAEEAAKEAEKQRIAEAEAKAQAQTETNSKTSPVAKPKWTIPQSTSNIAEADNDMDRLNAVKKVRKPKGRKKLSDHEMIAAALEAERLELERKTGKRAPKQTVNLKKVKIQGFNKPVAPIMKEVEIPENITVGDLGQRMSIKANELIKILMKMGVMATVNQAIDQETATLLVEELGHTYTLVKDDAIEDTIAVEQQEDDKDMVARAPVVTIMGHVDHGKTSLLDHIRSARVTDSEAGGITQHIGAYSVKTSKGNLTFLDTPGHEAFTAMRARGAHCTDIIILVVAADDGVMPQTIEAIQHAKAAGVPLIVAMNKMDKETADPERVKSELAQHDVISEDWGGEVVFAPVSAKTGDGVEDLLENVALQAEVLELKAPATGYATGVVIESRLDKSRGAIATILVQSGSLKQGDTILAGTELGRIRAMINDKGETIKEATASMPVEILGLSGVPNAGDDVVAVKDEKKAREVAEFRNEKIKTERLQQQQASKLANLFNRVGEEEEQQILSVIIKTDVQGSLEAIRDSLTKLSTDDIKLDIISSGIGGINSSDISLAVASQAVLFGFNVRADSAAKKQAEQESLEIRYYSIIYDLINDVRAAMSGMLSPELREEITGTAEVRDVFKSSKLGAIAGCMVIDGVIKRHNPIRVLRNQVVIYEGKLESLRRFKEDAQEVKKDTECGIGVKNYNDVKVGDHIEVFEVTEVAREI